MCLLHECWQYFSTYDSKQVLSQYLDIVTEKSYVRDPLFVCELTVLSSLVSGLQQICSEVARDNTATTRR